MPTADNPRKAHGAPLGEPARGTAPRAALEDGVGLCLSGGGYRAMLFHVGALWRLNETALLPRLDRVSSVSGGSITAATLALAWPRLRFEGGVARSFEEHVVAPLRSLAGHTLDVGAVLKGLFIFGSVGNRVVKAYDHYLFHGATLQDLPGDADGPRFVINATNLQSGVLWRFSKPYMGDYRVGLVRNPTLTLARAVAASSAFPPALSPVLLDLDAADFEPGSGRDLEHRAFRSTVALTDGGVYDNLGLETVWKRYRTVLISDGGGQMQPERVPKRDWPRHAYRVLSVVDNQVRSLRKRQAIAAFRQGRRHGTYWGIRTNVADYGLPDALPCPHARTLKIAEMATRLKRLDSRPQERLINWGYAVCDAALRRWVLESQVPPPRFPYPSTGVG